MYGSTGIYGDIETLRYKICCGGFRFRAMGPFVLGLAGFGSLDLGKEITNTGHIYIYTQNYYFI